MTAAIPVVDLAAADAGRCFVDAYERFGFARLVGHGIADETVAGILEQARRFHRLPDAAKRAITIDAHHRGYIADATATDVLSSVEAVDRPNRSESFMVLHDPDPIDVAAGTYLAGPNRWPSGLPGFRPEVEAYRDAMTVLGRRLIGVVATELGDDGTILSSFTRPTTWLRLVHYPAHRGRESAAHGSAPHRDFGALTILAQDDVGGLEVRDPSGGWIPVPPEDGTLVVNVGDVLHRWSGGRLRSTPHRVVRPATRDRFSAAFFFDPHVDTVVAPIPSCAGDDAITPFRFGDEVRRQLRGTYEQHRR